MPFLMVCTSDRAKVRIRDEYARRIAEGSIFDPHAGFDPRYYPGEVLASVIAIAEDTHDKAMMYWALSQLKVLRQRLELHNGFLIWPDEVDGQPTFGELAQSRLVLSLALIYRATGNDLAKQNALLAFAALERLPLQSVASSETGRVYYLPNYAYHDENNPRPISSRTLDPNHDAALAAAYTVMGRFLLNDPEAATRSLAKGRAYLAAALDLASAGKCLPLADLPDYSNLCDSRYNGFWSALLHIVGRYYPSDDAIQAADRQFAFASDAVVSFKTRRFYPDVMVGTYPDPVEPVLWISTAARSLSADVFMTFINRVNHLIEDGDAPSWPSGLLYPKYYE
jgi:hypothetical protein